MVFWRLMRYSAPEWSQVIKYIRAGDAKSAFALYRKYYPPSQNPSFPGPNEGSILRALALRPPSLSFLSDEDLREINVAAALALIGGSTQYPQYYFREGFRWNHEMTPRAALAHMFCWSSFMGRRERWRKMWGNSVAIRLSHSCDPGICPACTEAGRYLYTINTAPDLPIEGCSNLQLGCRCAWILCLPSDLDATMARYKLIPRWEKHPSEGSEQL